MTDPISFDDIRAAKGRLAGQAILTPLLTNDWLDEATGAKVFVKPETLQVTGSFKFRGAYNRVSLIPEAERKRGVVAFSSGNHAQGVAAAAKRFGVPATIVMPADAPKIKIENTKALGADVKLYDRYREEREKVAKEVVEQTGATLVKPFDDYGVIAGQGTVGLEIAEQAAAIGVSLDALLVCCGGGGLVSGTALAIKTLSPKTEVYAVEPEGFDDTKRSLQSGAREMAQEGAKSFCDALLSPQPGELTLPLNRRLLAGGLAVSDAEVAAAMRFGFERLKLVIEPGGAVALAALLSGKIASKGRKIGVVLSGGNVDPATFAKAIGQA